MIILLDSFVFVKLFFSIAEIFFMRCIWLDEQVAYEITYEYEYANESHEYRE